VPFTFLNEQSMRDAIQSAIDGKKPILRRSEMSRKSFVTLRNNDPRPTRPTASVQCSTLRLR
jgi:hypothetical protein